MKRPVWLAAGLILGGLALPALSPAQSVTVAVDGVPREVPVVERQGRRFVGLDTIARLLGGAVVEQGAERAILEVDEVRFVVRRRVPYVEVDGRWYQMLEAAQKDADGFYLPASALGTLLPVLWPGRFPAAPAEGSSPPPARRAPAPGAVESGMIGRSGGSDLEGVDFRVEPGRTRLGFRLARPTGVTVDDALPGTLQLLLADVVVPATVASGLTGLGLVDSVTVAAEDRGTALTLHLDPAASVYAVAPLAEPTGVEIVLRSGATDEAAILLASDVGVRAPSASPATAPSRRAAAGQIASASQDEAAAERPRPKEEWTIVLDAGHGGEDPGSIGPAGTREKNVTLTIARTLRDRLSDEPNVRVLLTREDDRFLPLGERTKRANGAGADLFVSIHANAARDAEAAGFETYFLSAAKTEDARRVARMENAVLRYENPQIDPESLDDLNFILWDLAQNEYLRESSALAEVIQEELNRRLPLKSRGVKQAGFFVLNGAFMPAVLFEMGFITNPREESQLNDPAFGNRLVDGLAESLLAYLDDYGLRLAAPSAAR